MTAHARGVQDRMSDLKSNTEIRMGSDRSFGIVFAVVFAIIGLLPLLRGDVRWWALAVAAVFLGVALVRAEWLRPLNKLWFRFGLLLNRVLAPLIMGLMFLITVVPIGLVFRLLRRDLLRQKFDPDAASYWIEVTDEHRAQSSMRNQF